MSSTPVALLRDRGYRTYLSAHLVGSFGDSIMWLAAGIWVQKLTGSNGGAALTFLFALLPALVAPLAGAIVDRVPRRSALVVLNLAGGLCVLPLLAVSEAGQVWLVYLVMFLNGLVSVGIRPAQSAQLVELAHADDLPALNGLLRSCLAAFKLVSPALGAGLFVAAGPQVVVLVDSVTSFVAAALLARLPRRVAPERQGGGGDFLRTFLDGFRALHADPALRRLTVVGCVFMGAAGTSESLRWAVVTEGLGRSAAWIGPLVTVMGLGSVATGLLASRVVGRAGPLRATALSLTMFGGGCALWLVEHPVAVGVGAVLVGGGSTLLVVATLVLLQQSTADHLQGKVFSAFELLTTGPQIASVALGAVLVTVVDYRVTMAALALVSLALAWYATAGPRHPRRAASLDGDAQAPVQQHA